MDRAQAEMKRLERDQRNRDDDGRDDQPPVSFGQPPDAAEHPGHATRCQTCDLQRKPPIRHPEIVSCCAEVCLIREEKLRPMSGT